MRVFYLFISAATALLLLSGAFAEGAFYSRPQDPCGGLDGKMVQFISDNGLFLSLCQDCGPGMYRDSVAVKEGYRLSHATWKIERYGNACGIKASNGKYMASCNKCWPGGSYDYSVFAYAPSPKISSAQWIITPHVDGTYTIMSKDIMMYVGRCYMCIPKFMRKNAAFIHFSKTNIIDPGFWRVIVAHDPEAGRPKERVTCLSFNGGPSFSINKFASSGYSR